MPQMRFAHLKHDIQSWWACEIYDLGHEAIYPHLLSLSLSTGWPQYCRKVYWTNMVQNGCLDLISNQTDPNGPEPSI